MGHSGMGKNNPQTFLGSGDLGRVLVWGLLAGYSAGHVVAVVAVVKQIEVVLQEVNSFLQALDFFLFCPADCLFRNPVAEFGGFLRRFRNVGVVGGFRMDAPNVRDIDLETFAMR